MFWRQWPIREQSAGLQVEAVDDIGGGAHDRIQLLQSAEVRVFRPREQECGMIKEGLDADLILLDFTRPHLMPCHNVISSLVYSARGSDVCMTMVRGPAGFPIWTAFTMPSTSIR